MGQSILCNLLFAASLSIMLRPSEAATASKDILLCVVIKNGTCPDNQYVKFNLYTRSSPNTSEIITLEPDNLSTTNFNTDNPTKIFIHGFNTNYTYAVYVELKNQLLANGDHNVIMVDWSRLCQGLRCYVESVWNTFHVAKCVAGFIQHLRSEGISDIHLIGHSLGGQTAGLTANYLKPYVLPKITGLDPAGPSYYTAPKDKKLDDSDAIFVEVLHTNVFMYGTAEQSGHVDYYFNGGSRQPGCGLSIVSCSHERSVNYYAESLNSAKGFWGWQCRSFTGYYTGCCGKNSRTLQVGDITNRGIVSVPTASSSPYALGK